MIAATMDQPTTYTRPRARAQEPAKALNAAAALYLVCLFAFLAVAFLFLVCNIAPGH